jgi:hypothetical protein
MRARSITAIVRVMVGCCAGQLATSATAQDLPLEWNLRAQVIGMFDKLESGQEGGLAFVSDSLGFALNSLNWFMRERFWADYGIAGDGYMAVGKGFTGSQHGPRAGISYQTSVSGFYLAKYTGARAAAGYYCPDGIYAQVFNAGFYRMQVYGPNCRLYYLVQPNGGVLRVTLDGEVLAELPTEGPTGHAAVDIDVGPDPFTLKTLEVSSADARNVHVRGIDMRTGLPGYTQHRLARGAAGPRDFNRSDTPETAAIIADLRPDVVIVMLDWINGDEKSTFIQDTNQLLDFYQQTLPEARFILMSHHPFNNGIRQEAVWLYEIAQDRDMGFINLFDTVSGGFEEMVALGYMLDEVHLTPAGGSFFGNYIYDLLERASVCPADLNSDGLLDLFDFFAFQNLFVNHDLLADCQTDGSFDLFDFLCFQNTFALGC